MPRHLPTVVVVIAIAVVSAACSSTTSTDSATSNTTQVQQSSKSTESTQPASVAGNDIDLSELAAGADAVFTEDEVACMEKSISAESAFDELDSYDDIVTQADRELFWTLVLTCTGPDPLVALFMEGFADSSGPEASADQLACVEDLVSDLSAQDGIALLSGDPTVTDALTTDVAILCLA